MAHDPNATYWKFIETLILSNTAVYRSWPLLSDLSWSKTLLNLGANADIRMDSSFRGKSWLSSIGLNESCRSDTLCFLNYFGNCHFLILGNASFLCSWPLLFLSFFIFVGSKTRQIARLCPKGNISKDNISPWKNKVMKSLVFTT